MENRYLSIEMKRITSVIRSMTRIFLLSLALCVLFGIKTFAASNAEKETPFDKFSGSGMSNDPYLIDDVSELIALREIVNSGTSDCSGIFFEQTADIDLSGVENWEPIGIFDSDHYFYGTYDGKGHSISNITIQRDDNCGLFGGLGGDIRNLNIEGGLISGACVGSIASHSTTDGSARIINCQSSANLTGTTRAGGIADNFTGQIVYCIFTGTVSTADGGVSGGIVSYDGAAGDIEYCYSTVDPLYPETYIGTADNNKVMTLESLATDSFLTSFNKVLSSTDKWYWGYPGLQKRILQQGNVSFDNTGKSSLPRRELWKTYGSEIVTFLVIIILGLIIRGLQKRKKSEAI